MAGLAKFVEVPARGGYPGWRAEPVQPIGCNDSARQSLASERHQTNAFRHMSSVGIASTSDCGATSWNSILALVGKYVFIVFMCQPKTDRFYRFYVRAGQEMGQG